MAITTSIFHRLPKYLAFVIRVVIPSDWLGLDVSNLVGFAQGFELFGCRIPYTTAGLATVVPLYDISLAFFLLGLFGDALLLIADFTTPLAGSQTLIITELNYPWTHIWLGYEYLFVFFVACGGDDTLVAVI
jgi:hypothetical protein